MLFRSDREQLPPEDRDRDRCAEQRGQVEDRPVEPDRLQPLVEQHGDAERHDQPQRNGEDHVMEGDEDEDDEMAEVDYEDEEEDGDGDGDDEQF